MLVIADLEEVVAVAQIDDGFLDLDLVDGEFGAVDVEGQPLHFLRGSVGLNLGDKCRTDDDRIIQPIAADAENAGFAQAVGGIKKTSLFKLLDHG